MLTSPIADGRARALSGFVEPCKTRGCRPPGFRVHGASMPTAALSRTAVPDRRPGFPPAIAAALLALELLPLSVPALG